MTSQAKQAYTREINEIAAKLSKKSTRGWIKNYCLDRLEAIWTDETLDGDIREAAAEASK